MFFCLYRIPSCFTEGWLFSSVVPDMPVFKKVVAQRVNCRPVYALRSFFGFDSESIVFFSYEVIIQRKKKRMNLLFFSV